MDHSENEMVVPILVAIQGLPIQEVDPTSNNEAMVIFLLETVRKILDSIRRIHIDRIDDMFVVRRHLFDIVSRRTIHSTLRNCYDHVI